MSKNILLAGASALALSFAASGALALGDGNVAANGSTNTIENNTNSGTLLLNNTSNVLNSDEDITSVDSRNNNQGQIAGGSNFNDSNNTENANGNDSGNVSVNTGNASGNSSTTTVVATQNNSNRGNVDASATTTTNNTTTNASNTGTIANRDVNVDSNNREEANGNESNNTLEVIGNGSGNRSTALSNITENTTVTDSTVEGNSASFANTGSVALNVLSSTISGNVTNITPAEGTTLEGVVVQNSANGFDGATSLVGNNGMQNNVAAALTVHVGEVNM